MTRVSSAHTRVSADGKRFLIATVPEQTASTPLTLVVNWPAGLKK